MKAHIAISILNSLLLTTTALTARAAEESIADHTPATTTGVIALGPTDTHFNISTLWEKQFSNDDANQDLMSMAVSAGNIFIGLVYYDAIDDRKGNLFIREFNTTTGEETDFTLLLPEKQAGHIYSNPIVFNDESEALYWGWVVQDEANKAAEQLQIFSIDATQTTYSFVKAHDIGVLTTAFTGWLISGIYRQRQRLNRRQYRRNALPFCRQCKREYSSVSHFHQKRRLPFGRDTNCRRDPTQYIRSPVYHMASFKR